MKEKDDNYSYWDIESEHLALELHPAWMLVQALMFTWRFIFYPLHQVCRHYQQKKYQRGFRWLFYGVASLIHSVFEVIPRFLLYIPAMALAAITGLFYLKDLPWKKKYGQRILQGLEDLGHLVWGNFLGPFKAPSVQVSASVYKTQTVKETDSVTDSVLLTTSSCIQQVRAHARTGNKKTGIPQPTSTTAKPRQSSGQKPKKSN